MRDWWTGNTAQASGLESMTERINTPSDASHGAVQRHSTDARMLGDGVDRVAQTVWRWYERSVGDESHEGNTSDSARGERGWSYSTTTCGTQRLVTVTVPEWVDSTLSRPHPAMDKVDTLDLGHALPPLGSITTAAHPTHTPHNHRVNDPTHNQNKLFFVASSL